jgi:hypothetical protein
MNPKQRAAQAAARVGGAVVRASASLNPLNAVASSVTGVVSSIVAGSVVSGWNNLLDWYRQRELVSRYGPIAGAIIGTVTILNFNQVMQLAKFASKALKIFRSNSAAAPGVLPSVVNSAKFQEEAKPQWLSMRQKMMLASILSLYVAKVRTYTLPLVGYKTPECRPRRWGLLILAVLLAERLGWTWIRNRLSPIGAQLTTPLVNGTLANGSLSSSQMRQVFVNTPVVQSQNVPADHTHGKSANHRNAGSATAALVANSLGLEPYYVQMSLSDVRKGRDGDRSFHWAKDLAVPPVDFHYDCTDQAAVLVDVDHYVNMPELMAKHPGTFLVSTFQPTASACGEGEFKFRFLPDGKVSYCVNGGAEYEHEVWDYKGDTLLVEDVGYFRKTIVSYHVDRKYVGPHHSLVMLSQIGRFEMPALLPTSWVIEGRALSRLRPVFGEYVVLDVMTPNGLTRSVSVQGGHTAVTLPIALIDAVRAVQTAAKVPITPAMVASNIAPSDASGLPTERMAPGAAALLAGYLRAGFVDTPPIVYPPTESMLPIWFAKHDYDAPVPLKGFGSPLIGPSYGYSQSLSSDDRCIAGRVEQFHSSEPEEEQPVPPTLAGYMVEFAQFLIPDCEMHSGVPVDHDEVYDRQDRPSQRALLDEAGVTGPAVKKVVKAFVKKETAVKPSDPRNISQMPEKLKYSLYMYAFHDGIMTKQDWYAFGKTPAECAQRVCDVLKDAAHSALADGSRFDGHVKRRARILERIIMLRFFHRQFHAELNEVMDAQIALPGVTTEGRRYFSGYGRGSGSLETSDFNSVLSCFIGYVGWRETTINGFRCTPLQAWQRKGIYGGDDSLEGAIDPRALKRAAEWMGQDYEIEVVHRGEIGVNFLNRQFGPDVWTGDQNSCANPSRLLAKLWVGPAVLPYPLVRFAERISGYYRMDRNSPVIGAICRVAHELLGEHMDGVLMPWDGKHSLESNWPNEDSGWMGEVFRASVPDFHWERFETWIQQIWDTRDPELLLQAPLCTAANVETPTVKQECVVGDTLLHPAPKPDADALPPKDKTELDGTRPLADGEPLAQAVWKIPENELDEVFDFSPEERTCAEEKVCCCELGLCCTVNHTVPYKYKTKSGEIRFREPALCVPHITAPGRDMRDHVPMAEAFVDPVVQAAAKLVPMVDEKGRRARKDAAPAAPKTGAKAPAAEDPKPKLDPRTWKPRKQRDGESPAEFKAYLVEWTEKRAKVAKRLGVSLK